MRRYRQPTGPTGAELKAARKAGCLSQTELAAKAGISRHAVSYWECRQILTALGQARLTDAGRFAS